MPAATRSVESEAEASSTILREANGRHELHSTFDRDVHPTLYGQSGVSETWLILPEKEVIEAHSSPSPRGYKNISLRYPGETVPVPGFDRLELPVNAV